jgi:hypothetical protein
MAAIGDIRAHSFPFISAYVRASRTVPLRPPIGPRAGLVKNGFMSTTSTCSFGASPCGRRADTFTDLRGNY